METEEGRPLRRKAIAKKRGQKRPLSGGFGSSSNPPPNQPPPPGPSNLVRKLRTGLVDKTQIPEVGMRIEDGKPEWNRYIEVIDELGWRNYVKPPREPYPEIVREFYANLPERTSTDYVQVFGHRVDMGPSAINRHYGLDDDDDDDSWCHYDSVHHTMEYGRIEHLLSLGKGLEMIRWKGRTIHSRSLCTEAHNWQRFLHRRFFGISNASDVTVLQQRLIYLMVTGQQIDVGRHIYRTICAKGDTMKDGIVHKQLSLPYPSLITELCLAAGVPAPFSQLKDKLHTEIIARPDKNPTLKEFFAAHWAGEGTEGWVRPKIRRLLGADELQKRQRQAIEAGVKYIPDIEDEPISDSAGPSTSVPQDQEMPNATFEQFGPSGTASSSQPPPSADYDFWSQPGWQSYLGQQESQWVQTQQYWADLQGQMAQERQERMEADRQQRQHILEMRQAMVEMEQRQTQNLQRQDDYWLQVHMHRMNLDGSDVPPPPNYAWPPPFGPPQ